MKGIFAGSFDPFTTEHAYIAKTAANLFDKLYVVVAVNDSKHGMFFIEDRVEIAKRSLRDINNIVVMATNQFVFELAEELGVGMLVRGLRYTTEYEYELKLATSNLELGNISTIGIFPRITSISSSDVRMLINHENNAWKRYVENDAAIYISKLLKDGRIN